MSSKSNGGTAKLTILTPIKKEYFHSKFVPDLSKVSLTDHNLETRDYPERGYLVEGLLQTKSLTMFYGGTGLGKSMLLMFLAKSLATATPFLGFPVLKRRRVLYIDGEMQLEDIAKRWKQISRGCEANGSSGRVKFLSSEVMVDTFQRYLNLNNVNDQEAVTNYLIEHMTDSDQSTPFDLIILDNLSSLTSGKEENSNTEQDVFLNFLRVIRHWGIAVILAHHTGKDQQSQRGGSRREDFLDTTFLLRKSDRKVTYPDFAFKMEMKKCRSKRPMSSDVTAEVNFSKDGSAVKLRRVKPTYIKVLEFIIQTGCTIQQEIADNFGFSKQAAAKHVKVLKDRGFIDEEMSVTGTGLEIVK